MHMRYQDSHPANEQLLLFLDGELDPQAAKQVRAHLEECWTCRARVQKFETTIAEFIGSRERELDEVLPPSAGARASLQAQLGQLSAARPERALSFSWTVAAIACGLLVTTMVLVRSASRPRSRGVQAAVVSVPDSRLTPGAALIANQRVVCSQANTNNKAVPVALQKRVFEEYGIAGADPRAYEVDYLVTPALGGADDIHNLWPHSYSAAIWNARVKDALEDRLRDMVCDGSLDLREAQQEIAADWIAAYKKYFHTDKPLPVLSK
jgi:hypothetical protein